MAPLLLLLDLYQKTAMASQPNAALQELVVSWLKQTKVTTSSGVMHAFNVFVCVGAGSAASVEVVRRPHRQVDCVQRRQQQDDRRRVFCGRQRRAVRGDSAQVLAQLQHHGAGQRRDRQPPRSHDRASPAQEGGGCRVGRKR